MYDIIIVGAGPAGLTAALYALRADKKVVIIEKESFGGQVTFSPKIENYPGFVETSGNELAEKLLEQVTAHGAEIELEEVTAIEDKEDFKIVTAGNQTFEGKAVILATGSKHRHLGLEKEDDFIGEGVSYCALCDGAFYSGKTVAMIGGGNTALQEAVMLSDICEKVIMIQNLDNFTGEQKLVNILQKRNNVKFIMGTVVEELIGDDSLKAIKIKNVASGETKEIELDGIFVAIGQVPANEPFKNVAKLNNWGYFEADEACESGTPGIFVAGDARSKRIRQITTACSDGTIASLAAIHYIDSLED